jgi:hypothetical protein
MKICRECKLGPSSEYSFSTGDCDRWEPAS